jgi:hypothetical protein
VGLAKIAPARTQSEWSGNAGATKTCSPIEQADGVSLRGPSNACTGRIDQGTGRIDPGTAASIRLPAKRHPGTGRIEIWSEPSAASSVTRTHGGMPNCRDEESLK